MGHVLYNLYIRVMLNDQGIRIYKKMICIITVFSSKRGNEDDKDSDMFIVIPSLQANI